jgi:hypothetical protein
LKFECSLGGCELLIEFFSTVNTDRCSIAIKQRHKN